MITEKIGTIVNTILIAPSQTTPERTEVLDFQKTYA
jgi:hypothetical protein